MDSLFTKAQWAAFMADLRKCHKSRASVMLDVFKNNRFDIVHSFYFTRRGVVVSNQYPDNSFHVKKRGRRGRISSFSSASVRRFRNFLVRYEVFDCYIYGITLTIPGDEVISDKEYRELHHKLVAWLNWYKIPVVWRIELQQRKMPHLHVLLYGNDSFVLRLMVEWYKLLDSLTPCCEIYNDDLIVSSSRAFHCGSSHAFACDRLNDSLGAYRYMVAHASKGKAVQLGWKGRQWGVVCRSKFSDTSSSLFENVPDKVYFRVIRWIRRLTRFKYDGRFGNWTLFCSSETLQRMIFFAFDGGNCV